MIKFIILGVVLSWLIYRIEKCDIDKIVLIGGFIEVGLFFNCVGLI